MKMIEREMWKVVAVSEVRGVVVSKESSLMSVDDCACALVALQARNTTGVLIDAVPVTLSVVVEEE